MPGLFGTMGGQNRKLEYRTHVLHQSNPELWKQRRHYRIGSAHSLDLLGSERSVSLVGAGEETRQRCWMQRPIPAGTSEGPGPPDLNPLSMLGLLRPSPVRPQSAGMERPMPRSERNATMEISFRRRVRQFLYRRIQHPGSCSRTMLREESPLHPSPLDPGLGLCGRAVVLEGERCDLRTVSR